MQAVRPANLVEVLELGDVRCASSDLSKPDGLGSMSTPNASYTPVACPPPPQEAEPFTRTNECNAWAVLPPAIHVVNHHWQAASRSTRPSARTGRPHAMNCEIRGRETPNASANSDFLRSITIIRRHASKERVLLFGTDQRITSGPAARTAAFKGRIHGCTRTIRGNVRFSSCTAGAVHTWHKAALAAAQINQSQRDQSGHRPDVHCRCPASFKTRARWDR
jgi:hypothetical protein